MKCAYLDCQENKYIFCNEEATMKVKVPCHEKSPMCEAHGQKMVAKSMSKRRRHLGDVQVDRMTA